MKLLVKKHPSAHTLAECIEADDTAIAENGYVAMTVPEFEAWEAAAIAAGWQPPQVVVDDTPVPESVGPAQLRIAIHKLLGLSGDAVAARIAEMQDGESKTEAAIFWEYATEFRRDHPLIAALASALGINAGGVDTIFKEAMKY